MTEPVDLNLHEDVALFREAVNFTASRTGFNARLIEKDYFCTVLLAYLARCGGDQLVFKGGTCLAKIHAGFYRVSEDLDFTIPTPLDAGRTQRRQAAAPVKDAVARVAGHIPAFETADPLTGANNSTQYNGAVAHQSPTTGQRENIFIEVSVREPLLMPASASLAETMLLDPISGEAAVRGVAVSCIAVEEAMAEKCRAALSRKDVAIRDFYDLDHAVQHLALDPSNARLVDMIRQKLAVPGNLPVDVSVERLESLRRQLGTRLRAVLPEKEFRAFDLNQAIQLVVAMAQRVG